MLFYMGQDLCVVTAVIIVVLNAKLVYEEVSSWIDTHGWGIGTVTVLLLLIASLLLLLYITFSPFWRTVREPKTQLHEAAPGLDLQTVKPYVHVAITVDFSTNDRRTISAALQQGGTEASYLLIHITESAAARYLGAESGDRETIGDAENLDNYVLQLRELGYIVEGQIGQGHAPAVIAEIVNRTACDLLVMGAHGHRVSGYLLGTTVDAVRHRVKVPVFIVQ